MPKYVNLNNKEVEEVIDFLRNKVYPTILEKIDRFNYTKKSKKFILKNDKLFFKGKNINYKI